MPGATLADVPVALPTAVDPAFAADRASILVMAGADEVRFDMRETTAWRADFTPIKPAPSSPRRDRPVPSG